MNARPKRLPRLWCALQGVLPLDPERALQGPAWARQPEITAAECGAAEPAMSKLRPCAPRRREGEPPRKTRNHVAGSGETMNVHDRGSLRNQS